MAFGEDYMRSWLRFVLQSLLSMESLEIAQSSVWKSRSSSSLSSWSSAGLKPLGLDAVSEGIVELLLIFFSFHLALSKGSCYSSCWYQVIDPEGV